MAPITPSGTRSLVSFSPLGSVRSSITSPTGSGSPATVFTSAAIPLMRSELSMSLSSIEALMPPASASL